MQNIEFNGESIEKLIPSHNDANITMLMNKVSLRYAQSNLVLSCLLKYILHRRPTSSSLM